MNVTKDEFRSYIECFLSTLEATAAQYLPEDLRRHILHLSLLPARVIGYVSTQFGVAIEYQPADATLIEVRLGSARVEDLLVQAPSTLRDVGPAVQIAARGLRMFNMILSGGFPFRLMNSEADATIADTAFKDGPWRRQVHYAEVFGDRSRQRWAKEQAVAAAKDEVLLALSNFADLAARQSSQMRAAIIEARRAGGRAVTLWEDVRRFKEKGVLLLGDYSETGAARLEAISRALMELGYAPFLVKDVSQHPHQAAFQTTLTLGAMSRFIVADDSSKASHLCEIESCRFAGFVMVILRAHEHPRSFMTAGLSHTSNVIHEMEYDPATPVAAVTEAVRWAEHKLEELGTAYDETYRRGTCN